MVELRWETDIHASIERVFSLLSELRDYGRWLPTSRSYRGTTTLSDGPIAKGTTYVEQAPLGIRHGTVTEFDRPTRLNFEQPMTMNPPILGTIDIRVFHTLTPGDGCVRLQRTVQISPRGPIGLAMPLAIRTFRNENDRIMKNLKSFAETAEPQTPA